MAALNFLLQLFYSFTNNYGLAIIFLTVLVKLLLLPLTIKQTRSMLAMQKIQPELKKIQEKYKDDKQKQSEEMMRFYRENKINPLSGCLPLIMQMPIFIALYMVLRKYVITPPIMLFGNVLSKMAAAAGSPNALLVSGELVRNTGFIGIDNLSESARAAGAAGVALVVLLMASTWYSQKQVTTDPRQKNMMLIMPLLMGFIAVTLPTGVVMYWVTTNVLQIAQQAGMRYWDKRRGEEGDGKAAPKERAVVREGGEGTRERPQKQGKASAAARERPRTGRPLPGARKEGAAQGAKKEGGRPSGKAATKKSAAAGHKPARGGQPRASAGGKGGGSAVSKDGADRRKPPPRGKKRGKDG